MKDRQVKETLVYNFFKGNGKPAVVGQITQVVSLGSPGGRRRKKHTKGKVVPSATIPDSKKIGG